MGPPPHPPQGDPLTHPVTGSGRSGGRSRSGPGRSGADAERLVAALAALPETHRSVVVLHDVHGLDLKETASAVGVGRPTAGRRLSDARRRLQRELYPVSGDLRPHRRPHGRGHVESCLRCQAELAQYRRLLRALHELGPGGPETSAAPHLDPTASHRAQRRLAVAVLAGAAAVAAGMAAGAAAAGTRPRAR